MGLSPTELMAACQRAINDLQALRKRLQPTPREVWPHDLPPAHRQVVRGAYQQLSHFDQGYDREAIDRDIARLRRRLKFFRYCRDHERSTP